MATRKTTKKTAQPAFAPCGDCQQPMACVDRGICSDTGECAAPAAPVNGHDVIDFEADVRDAAPEPKDRMERISILAQLQTQQEAAVAAAEAALALAKEQLRRTAEEDLPQLMEELDLKSFTLGNGAKIDIRDEVQCGISEERRPVAHKWLIDHRYGGLIKTEVAIAFGRGEREKAEKLIEQLKKKFPDQNPEVKEAVHPSTLKAFVKERLEAAAETKPADQIPFDLFAIRPYKKAKITLPK